MYTAKNYSGLLGLPGFSDQLLKNHFTLYEGYIANVNKVFEIIDKMEAEDKLGTPEFAEIKRRLGWEFDGMRLHELYFENLMRSSQFTANSSQFEVHSSQIGKMIEKDYGSFAAWEKYFRATGAMRGIGWVVLCYDKLSNQLFTEWINEHDVGHLVGCTPLLVMDVFEHAFMLDYGLKRTDYINAFFKAINWQEVEKRLA